MEKALSGQNQERVNTDMIIDFLQISSIASMPVVDGYMIISQSFIENSSDVAE